MNIVDDLTAKWMAEKERADYAWRNTRTIEAARAEEMRKRDAAEAENTRLRAALKKANDQAEHFEREWYLRGDEIERLRTLAKAVLDTRDAEAKAAMTMENAQANFCRGHAEACERAHLNAMVAASEAEKALHDALATHNVKVRGPEAALSPEAPSRLPGSGPLDILDCLQDRPDVSGKAVPGKCVNLAPCEVGREWRKCWRSGCANAERCVAPNAEVRGDRPLYGRASLSTDGLCGDGKETQ